MSKPVGYFVWCRSAKGPPHFPKKFGADFLPIAKDSKWYMEMNTIGDPIPLMQEEWELDLDALAVKYPPPRIVSAAR